MPAAERSPLPRVLVPGCARQVGDLPYQVVGQKYLDAVRLAGALPLMAPAAEPHEVDALLDLADGLLLPGSPSNVHPRHFGEEVLDDSLPLDPARDATTLALIPRALERGIPLLGICRGFQEVNVALGGSLHQAVHQQPGLHDHREDFDAPPADRYAPAHPVHLEPGGLLAGLAAPLGGLVQQVNSLHGQGVAQLAPGLRVEARAPDGLVEAVTLPSAPGFNLAVQWHVEWRAAQNPFSRAVLQAFGRACAAHRARRTHLGDDATG